ncbi:MAG: NUDIX domain-containing protein [Anaerolineae bacterium]|nr:NUDIX domain-containing protein [Anaerolineae bacterium]
MDYIPWIRSKVGHEKIILVVALVILYDEEGKILLQKRAKDEEVWSLPGGIMELGESAAETAVREAKEETGLDIEVTSLFGVYTKYSHQYGNGDNVQPIAIVFNSRVIGGELEIDGQETHDLCYFKPEEAPKLFTAQNDDILADICQQRTGNYR